MSARFPSGSFLPFLFIFILIALAAGAAWFAPYTPQDEDRMRSYHPPSKIRFSGHSGKDSLRPFIHPTTVRFDESLRRTYVEDTGRKVFVAFGGGHLFSVPRGEKIYLLGADSRGRDIFSRLLYGTRISLAIALLGVLIATSIGLVIGGTAGYFGGMTDQVLMRLAEFFIMIPGFYLLLALRSALPPQLGSTETFVLIVVILSVIGWGSLARVIRGMTLSLRESDFVSAAKVLGRPHREILAGHIVPHLAAYLGIVLSLAIPGYILGESALSLLGLGIQEPDVSLGNLLKDALSIPHIEFHPWTLFPGFWIGCIVFNFYLLGDLLARKEKDE